MKLWQGRYFGAESEQLRAVNDSIRFDARLYKQDIGASAAHARMLGHCGILQKQDAEAIEKGLAGILADLMSGALEIDETSEDIHTFVEAELTKRIGAPGKMLHTARSRNDQVATDLRLYLADAQDALLGQCAALAEVLCGKAELHLETVMPGYTHLQRAQPITLAHELMAYVWMLLRDMERLRDCQKRTKMLPLGSCALAGTTYPIDRQFTAAALGMTGVCPNSIDAVADRDFVLELLGCLSILMTHLSRLSEELVLWCSSEFGFVTFADSFTTGSSIMPQKKNPDAAELVRGKAGRVFGNCLTLLTVMKGLPLAYNKDLQEDKEAVFDALDTVSLCLQVLAPMLQTAEFHKDALARAASRGFINATDCADYLAKKGLPFRDAYRAAGRLVDRCAALGCTLETLPLAEYTAQSALFAQDIYEAVDLLNCVKRRASEGGPAPEQVRGQIALARQALAAGEQEGSGRP